MSGEQLRALPALISVGSHTLTHPHLQAVSAQAAGVESASPGASSSPCCKSRY